MMKDILSRVSGIGIVVLFAIIVLAIVICIAMLAPTFLCIAGVKYSSVIMLIAFLAIVLLSADIIKAVISAIYQIVRKKEDINTNGIGHLILDILTIFAMVILVDDSMEAVEVSTVSALIFTLLYVFGFKVLDIVVDNIGEEEHSQ